MTCLVCCTLCGVGPQLGRVDLQIPENIHADSHRADKLADIPVTAGARFAVNGFRMRKMRNKLKYDEKIGMVQRG